MAGNFDPSALREFGPFYRMLLFPRGPLRLYVVPTSAGYDLKQDVKYDYPGIERGPGQFVLLQYTISGRGNLTYEGRHQVIGPGQAMVLCMPHDHRYWLAEGDQWEFFWICISGREAVRIWSAVIAAHGPIIDLPRTTAQRIANIVKSLAMDPRNSAAQSSASAYAVCMALAEDFLENGQAFRTKRRNSAVRSVIDHVRQHIDQPISIDTMAEMAGYSRSHFTRSFEQSEGISPARFVLEMRLRAALTQLQAGEKSVKQVAYSCGFRDPSYFTKTFRRVYGVAPSELSDGLLASSMAKEPSDQSDL